MGDFGSAQQLLAQALSVPSERLALPECERAGIELWLRRDDLIDPHASGNKYYKLFFNIARAQALGKRALVTFGGPWSNHLYALAHTARRFGLCSRAVLRAPRPANLSATLRDCEAQGMQLDFIDRTDYRRLTASNEAPSLADDEYFIPAGGANALGINGCQYLGKAIATTTPDADYVCLAVGTGGSFQGVAQGVHHQQTVLGFPVLKAGNQPMQLPGIGVLPPNGRLLWGYHLGGYGKPLPESAQHLWRRVEQHHGVPLDPVYTLKLLWGIECLARLGYWRRGVKVLALHTGGLQGWRGFADVVHWARPDIGHCAERLS